MGSNPKVAIKNLVPVAKAKREESGGGAVSEFKPIDPTQLEAAQATPGKGSPISRNGLAPGGYQASGLGNGNDLNFKATPPTQIKAAQAASPTQVVSVSQPA